MPPPPSPSRSAAREGRPELTRLPSLRSALLLLGLALCAPAAAQECPRPAGAGDHGIASQSDQQRLDALAALAGREAAHFGTWKLLSGAAFGLLVVGQLGLAPLMPAETRSDYYFGAAYSALGMASTLVGAPAVFERGPPFAREAAAATAENRCELIAEGERLLERSAAEEALPRQWYMHVVNVAVNLSLGAILGFGYQHWATAALNTGVGIALSEAILFTRPNALGAAWRDYLTGEQRVSLQVLAGPAAGGGVTVGVGGRF
jgi:hypothetical protein